MKKFLFFIVFAVIMFVAGLFAEFYLSYGGQGSFDLVKLLQGTYTFVPLVGFAVLYLLYFLNKLADGKDEKPSLGSKTKEGKDLSQYFDSRWVTEKELKTEKKFMYCNWNTIRNCEDGILLRSVVKGNNLDINMYNPIHTLIIGTTGVGKTQKYIEPTIEILSSTKTKPSFVITDPKGELYANHTHKLKMEGYDVKTFNLRQPYASACWNPMDNSYLNYQKAFSLYDNVKSHVGVNPSEFNLKIIAEEYNNEWFEYDGVAYPNKELLDTDLASKKAELIDEAENELREIATAICPIETKGDQSWERGAQEFIFGTMIAMLEDTLKPELGMTREKFNFYNLTKICTYKDPDPDNPYKTLRQYFTGRDKFSKVLPLVSTAINNAPTTTRSYMGIVTAHLGIFNDNGMCFATSANEIDFNHFGDRPTALFIIIPDEKISRHSIATMMVSQLYKKLVEIANGYPKKTLPRRVYFLLDEFANLPKIDKIDTIITVSRSRNIFFSLVIQSYSQLNAKYGDDVAQTIRGNCPIKMFIGTDDQKTCEEFSKSCGDVTLQTISTSESRQKDEKGKENPNKTTSLSTTSRPLIYPDELGHVAKKDGSGEMVIKIMNEFPIRTYSDPAWKTPMFDKTKTTDQYVVARALNEEKVLYSIAERNQKVLRPMITNNSDF